MDLEDLRTAKKTLEGLIRDDIALRLKEFEADTGWTPSGIYVNFVETTTWGAPRPEYTLSSVTVKLEDI
ncbi:MAG: hypothetical protein ACXAEN_23965 [Candidatus Thorarchaeota archaeon]|jgi:hypothetical protein